MSKLDEIKNFLSADHEEMEKRYRKRMGYTDDEPTEEDMEAPAEESVEEVQTKEETSQYNNISEDAGYDEDADYDEDYDYDEDNNYEYTEENAHLRSEPELIDKEPRKDKEGFKLPKPKTMSEIEGDIEVEDKERGIVFTSDEKDGDRFNRLYDISGEKPDLLASGDIDYKDGMFIVHHQNKHPLYKLDKGNKPNFVAASVKTILNDGWFEQSPDYSWYRWFEPSPCYLCKDENDGKYRRVMYFLDGHREVTADGTIIDELDNTNWYHKDEYKYDAEKHTLKFVKGKGSEKNGYNNDEQHQAYDYDTKKTIETKYGTFFHYKGKYLGGFFVKTDGSQDSTFGNGGLYNQISVHAILPSGLAKISRTTYSSGFGNWGRESKYIYDFKTSSYREDLEDIRKLGDKFYAAKKNGEDKFGIYEMADGDMKNPMIMVDDCELIRRTGVMFRNIKELDTNIILFSVGDTKCRCEITPEGKLKPIAKLKKDDKDLYLCTGSQWVKVDLPEDARAHIREEEGISIDRWANNGGCCDRIYLSNTDALEFAHSIAKTAQKEEIKEQPQETYHNAKERLVKHIAETKAMADDIRSGMAKTKESGYKHISRTSAPNKGGRED